MFAIFDWYAKYYNKIIGIRLLYQWLVSLPCMPKTLMFQCFSPCKCDNCQTLYGGSTHWVVPARIISSYLDQVSGSQQQQSDRKNSKLNIVVNSGPVHVNFWGTHSHTHAYLHTCRPFYVHMHAHTHPPTHPDSQSQVPVSQTIRFLCPRRSMFLCFRTVLGTAILYVLSITLITT